MYRGGLREGLDNPGNRSRQGLRLMPLSRRRFLNGRLSRPSLGLGRFLVIISATVKDIVSAADLPPGDDGALMATLSAGNW
jgi:hypothetical protein